MPYVLQLAIDSRAVEYEAKLNIHFKECTGENRVHVIQEYRKDVISECVLRAESSAGRFQPEENKQCKRNYIMAAAEWFSVMPATVKDDLMNPATNPVKMTEILARDLVWVCSTLNNAAKSRIGHPKVGKTDPEKQEELKKLFEQEADGNKRLAVNILGAVLRPLTVYRFDSFIRH